MIIHNKLDNYFVVSADKQAFLGFEMTANLRDTSPSRRISVLADGMSGLFGYCFITIPGVAVDLGTSSQRRTL